MKLLKEYIRGKKIYLQMFFSIFKIKKYSNYKKKKKIVYMLTPMHGNMGDQAITYATKKFYEDNFADYDILEVTRDEFYENYFAIKHVINKEDFIVIHGGGNMGNLYLQEEYPRRLIIKKFKNNKIVSMTQTITVIGENSDEEIKSMSRVYNSNKNLLLLAREKVSFIKMKSIFTNPVILVPDIVLYMNKYINNNVEERKLITTCLRNDKESIISEKKQEFLQLMKEKYEIFEYDTNININLNRENRFLELKNMWNNFQKSKVVITDRLHGMIFCVITKTPCIVMKSLDHKISSSYEWIKKLNYVVMIDELDFSKIDGLLQELMQMNVCCDINFDEEYFEPLANEIRKFIEQK